LTADGVEAAEKLFEMAITVGEEVFNFVLDTVSTLAHGVSWVFYHLGVAREDVIDYLGFVFDWEDTLVTADSMVAFLNAGLDYGNSKLSELEENAKTWISGMKTTVIDALQNLPNQVQDQQLDPALHPDITSQGQNQLESSVIFNWVGYQLQHGGCATNAVIKPPTSGDGEGTS
jgi:hypothetical protein